MKKQSLLLASIIVLFGASGSLCAMKRKRCEDDDVNRPLKKRKTYHQPEGELPVPPSLVQQLEQIEQGLGVQPQPQVPQLQMPQPSLEQELDFFPHQEIDGQPGERFRLGYDDEKGKADWSKNLIKILRNPGKNYVVKLIVRNIGDRWPFSERDEKNIALIKELKNLEIVELYFSNYNASAVIKSYLKAIASLKKLKHLTVEKVRYGIRALTKISKECELESLTLINITSLNNCRLREIVRPSSTTLKELTLLSCCKDSKSNFDFNEKAFEVLAECRSLEKLVIKDDKGKQINKEGLISTLKKCPFVVLPKVTFNGEFLLRQEYQRQWPQRIRLQLQVQQEELRRRQAQRLQNELFELPLLRQLPQPQQQQLPQFNEAFPEGLFLH